MEFTNDHGDGQGFLRQMSSDDTNRIRQAAQIGSYLEKEEETQVYCCGLFRK